MPTHGLLAHLLLSYALGLVFIVALARVRIPAIVALMLAGIAAGPWSLRIISSPEEVDALAEVGIVLLLFTVGLDFSLTAMRQIWRTVVLAGTLQMVATVAVIGALALLLPNVDLRLAVFVGLFVALSSTAIVLKGLAGRNELSAPHGRLTVGILLLQDLAIVVLLLLVPILSGETAASEIPWSAAKALLAIALVAAASRIVLPLLLRIVTASGRREAFPLAILIASVGTAWLSTLVGLSMAVGAFLAGLMLAESEFHHQAYAEIRPVRDVLAGLFFISLGLLLDVPGMLRQLPLVLAIAAVIMVVKSVVAAAALIVTAAPVRVAIMAGVALAQVGEFSFIVGRTGLASGLLPQDRWQALLGASIVTMMLTPLLLAIGPALATRLRGKASKPQREAGMPHLTGHVIVLGFGVGGHLVARALRELGVPYLILELNGATVQRMKAEGERIFYGDATSPESLHAAGVESAAALVCMMSDPDAAERMVPAVRRMAPRLPIIVRTRYRAEAERLQALGATVAVAEELEASLEVLAQLLARLQVAGNIIETLLDVFRRESVAMRPLRAPRAAPDALHAALTQMPVATHRLEPGHWAIGRTLAEINLRADTGASVLALQNGSEYVAALSPDRRLAEGDVLYLVGDDSDILLARAKLTEGR
jgi:CPA2 family monovalent cation:H+ antiporter-2